MNKINTILVASILVLGVSSAQARLGNIIAVGTAVTLGPFAGILAGGVAQTKKNHDEKVRADAKKHKKERIRIRAKISLRKRAEAEYAHRHTQHWH
jgi:hypothetical protein